jgi:hypothetical protein
MPAGLPGATPAENQANPSKGATVIFDLLSGPKGSPFDNDKDYAAATAFFPTSTGAVANLNDSTGGLATGIGFGSPPVIGPVSDPLVSNAVRGIRNEGFTDDYKPGISTPTPGDSPDSTYMYIGGGKCTKNVDGHAPAVPYTAGFGIGNAGNGGLTSAGGSRDAGAGPAFTGFGMKMVTAAAGVAVGAAVEAGWVNRSGQALVTDQSVFGSSTTASAAVV